ncbi:Fe-S-containing protein [Methanococcoides sp. LMO-2]|uniref:Fe-S-containing protein n=1 Tax=Methanococcoides cohabitans TaxID=3136559 RepID=A0ABU9KYY0_9EURY
MRSKLAAYIVIVAVVFAAGCVDDGAQATAQTKPVSATWIEPQLIDDTVVIPVQTIEESMNTHFKMETSAGEIAVMAYMLGDEIVVRSNVCPPCGSIGFSLQDELLICDACRTTFDTGTGQGIQGACVDYPKENIPYEETEGNVMIKIDDIVIAHMNTVQRG